MNTSLCLSKRQFRLSISLINSDNVKTTNIEPVHISFSTITGLESVSDLSHPFNGCLQKSASIARVLYFCSNILRVPHVTIPQLLYLLPPENTTVNVTSHKWYMFLRACTVFRMCNSGFSTRHVDILHFRMNKYIKIQVMSMFNVLQPFMLLFIRLTM